MSPTSSFRFHRWACLFLVLGVAGCTGWDDPFQREGTWSLEYNNDANLGVMVADPGNVVEGVNDDQSPAVLSADAVHRLLTGHVKPLTGIQSTDIGPPEIQSQPSAASTAAGAPQ